MSVIDFHIPGPPVGKERHRINKKTGAIYTPANTKKYEKFVGECAWTAIRLLPRDEWAEWPDRKVNQIVVDMWIAHAHKLWSPHSPDADNVEKAILDGMEGIVYQNDKQAVPRVQPPVVYESDNPGVRVRIEKYQFEKHKQLEIDYDESR